MTLRLLRLRYLGVLRCDAVVSPTPFVIDPASGELILPLARRDLDASEHVLHTPDESDSSLQLLLDPRPIDPRADPGADRFAAFHGTSGLPILARARVLATRLAAEVLDEPDLRARLHLDEPRILRSINTDLDLRARAARFLGATASVVFVGADELGVDARGTSGPWRIPLPREAADPADLLALLRETLP